MKCRICAGNTTVWMSGLFDDRHGFPGLFNLRRCQNCGFAQTDPRLPEKQIAEIYNQFYPRKIQNMEAVNPADFPCPNRLSVWLKGTGINCHYQAKPGSRVLDVGCGSGSSLLELKNMSCEAFGVDPEPTAGKLARKYKLKFHRGFLTDNPWPGKKFDYITASQVLEHINDPAGFVRLCRTRLSPGGRLVLSFPNIDSWSKQLLGKRWLHWHIPFHLNHFSRKSVEIMAKKTGMQVEKLSTITPNLWVNLQLRRLLQRPVPGQRDSLWDGKNGHQSQTPGMDWLKLLWITAENFNILSRIPDVFGGGGSFLLILK